MRLTAHRGGKHHLTIPAREAVWAGTIRAVLRNVAEHHQLSREELHEQLFSWSRERTIR
jgi:hypothetical protein